MKVPTKFAFVAGCNGYQGTRFTALTAPINDVMAMSTKCKQHGFDVQSCSDVSYDCFKGNLKHAARTVTEHTKVIIFHWSGHATSEKGRPVLHPIQGGPLDLADAIQTLSQKASPKAVTFVILDCCREEEQESLRKALKNMPDFSPEVRQPGLGKLSKYRQLVYIQACAPGCYAREEAGEAGHGYLTKAALAHLFEEGPLTDILKKIQKRVSDDTSKKQDVWISNNCWIDSLSTWGNPHLYEPCCFKLACSASEHQEKLAAKHQQEMNDLKEEHKIQLNQMLAEKERELRESHDQEMCSLREECAVEHASLRQDIFQLQAEKMELKDRPASAQRKRTSSGSSVLGSPSRSMSLVDGSLSTLLEQRRKPWIVIDGLLGVGKSSLAELFKEEVEPNMHIVYEPIEAWSEQLSLYYADRKQHAFGTNIMLLQHHLKTADLIAASDPKRGVISERSPVSQVKIFGEIAHEAGELTAQEFKIMKQFLSQLQEKDPPCMPTHYVLLEADVDTCLERLRNRGRPYEQSSDMRNFLVKVDDKLKLVYQKLEEKKEMKLACGAEVIRIPAKCSAGEVCKVFLEKMSHLWSGFRTWN